MKIRRSIFHGTVVGLDLSLTASAACAIRVPWDGKIENVEQMEVAGYKLTKDATEREQRERIKSIRRAVLSFCRDTNAHRVVVEDYAFSAQGQITRLAELCGVVKMALDETFDLHTETVRASQARKLLLQKLPQKDSKLFTHVNVRRLGGSAATWTGDEIDALVVANYAVMMAGGTPVSFEGQW